MSTAVKISGRLITAVAAVSALYAGFAVTATRPADAKAYARSALQSAAAAHDAAATGALIGRQQLNEQVFAAFSLTAYADAAKSVADAARTLAEEPPPDGASAELRDQIQPLIQDTSRSLGNAAAAPDLPALRTAVAGLTTAAEQLDDIIEQHR